LHAAAFAGHFARVPVTNPHTVVPRISSEESGAISYSLLVLSGADWLFPPQEYAAYSLRSDALRSNVL